MKESPSISDEIDDYQMYRRKRDCGSLYTIHNPHTDGNSRDWSKLQVIRAVSIDPGKANMCIRVEDRPLHGPGTITPRLYERVSFTSKSDEVEDTTYTSISRYLASISDLLLSAHLVVIEKQLPDNYPLVRISQHLLTWFLEYLRDRPELAVIAEVSGKIKGQAYGVTDLNKPAMKKWSGTVASALLARRKDEFSHAIITKSRKKDDLGDVVIQLEAFCELLGWYSDK